MFLVIQGAAGQSGPAALTGLSTLAWRERLDVLAGLHHSGALTSGSGWPSPSSPVDSATRSAGAPAMANANSIADISLSRPSPRSIGCREESRRERGCACVLAADS